jgi:hypothetical protein
MVSVVVACGAARERLVVVNLWIYGTSGWTTAADTCGDARGRFVLVYSG